MATFILKLNNRQIDYDALPLGTVKKSFSDLRDIIINQLHSRSCQLHHHEPIVILQSDGHTVTLSGISTCCSEFGAEVRRSLILPIDVMGSEYQARTRTYLFPSKS